MRARLQGATKGNQQHYLYLRASYGDGSESQGKKIKGKQVTYMKIIHINTIYPPPFPVIYK